MNLALAPSFLLEVELQVVDTVEYSEGVLWLVDYFSAAFNLFECFLILFLGGLVLLCLQILLKIFLLVFTLDFLFLRFLLLVLELLEVVNIFLLELLEFIFSSLIWLLVSQLLAH